MILLALLFLILLIYFYFKKYKFKNEPFSICNVPYRIENNCYVAKYNECIYNYHNKNACSENAQRSCVVPTTISPNYMGPNSCYIKPSC